jgi:hypothetical protein
MHSALDNPSNGKHLIARRMLKRDRFVGFIWRKDLRSDLPSAFIYHLRKRVDRVSDVREHLRETLNEHLKFSRKIGPGTT